MINDNNKLYQEQKNLLLNACREGDIESALELINNGNISVNIQNDEYEWDDRDTPLMRACRHNHIDICKILLKKGADLNIENKAYQTAFMLACEYGNLEIVKLLFRHGANIIKRRKSIIRKIANNAIDKFMIKYKDTIIKDFDFDTNMEDLLNLIENKKILNSMPLSHGNYIKINKKDCNSDTALTLAIKYGYLEVVRFLLKNGADVYHSNQWRRNSFEVAKEFKKHAILDLLNNFTKNNKI